MTACDVSARLLSPVLRLNANLGVAVREFCRCGEHLQSADFRRLPLII